MGRRGSTNEQWNRWYHSEGVAQRRSHRRKQNPRNSRSIWLKSRYGLTMDDYDLVLQEQNGVCAICLCPPHEGKFLYVDHNHDTGKVRGLLCQKCNSGIGYLNDDPLRVASALRYLTN